MSDRVERHFAVLRRAVAAAGGEVFATMGDGIAAAFASADGGRARRDRRPARMPAIGLAVRMGIHTGEVERVGDDFRGRPSTAPPASWPSGHGGQILLSDVAAALVRTGPEPASSSSTSAPTACATSPSPSGCGRCVHPELPSDVPAGARRSTRTPTTCRRSARRWSAASATSASVVAAARQPPHRHPHRRRRGRQDPPGACRPRPSCCRRFANVWFVELASVTDPDDVADAIALTVGAAGVADRRWRPAAALLGGDAHAARGRQLRARRRPRPPR